MSTLVPRAIAAWHRTTRMLEWFAPLSLLSFRLWVAMDFWNAGRVKIADMSSTVSLFQNLYHVPLLPPVAAAYIGTGVELTLPWFLGLGIGGRVTAAVLFVYNIIAVISYPDLWPGGLWHDFRHGGFIDHKVWALMLAAVVLMGPGRISFDALFEKWFARWFGRRLGRLAP